MYDRQTSPQTTYEWYALCTVAEVASGFNYAQARDSAHNLLSPCMVVMVAALTDSGQSRTLLLSMFCVP